ncbi:hypothetical protein D3C85_1368500 [compost metagenome]
MFFIQGLDRLITQRIGLVFVEDRALVHIQVDAGQVWVSCVGLEDVAVDQGVECTSSDELGIWPDHAFQTLDNLSGALVCERYRKDLGRRDASQEHVTDAASKCVSFARAGAGNSSYCALQGHCCFELARIQPIHQ